MSRGPHTDAPVEPQPSPCPDDHQLVCYLEGRIAQLARARVEEHLVHCASCAETVAEITAQLYPTGTPSPEAVECTSPPARTLDRYELFEELGAGAMGVVYRAWDPGLQRDVAFKLIRPDLFLASGGASLRERFRREARALARLSHAHVVPIYDSGESEQGVYIVMEYVQGASLREWLAEQQPSGWRVVQVFLQVGRGLLAAHAAGLVHRDVKPDNILVGEDGRARISDFGLAVNLAEPEDPQVQGADPSARLTRTGVLLGTPAYMAPEQLIGHRVDARSDQYSFCATLFEAISGEQVNDPERWLGAALQTEAEPTLGAQLPNALRRVLRRGLRTRAADRYPDLDALLMELEAAAAPDAWKDDLHRRSRWPWVLVAGLVVLVILASAVGHIATGHRVAIGPMPETPPGVKAMAAVAAAPGEPMAIGPHNMDAQQPRLAAHPRPAPEAKLLGSIRAGRHPPFRHPPRPSARPKPGALPRQTPPPAPVEPRPVRPKPRAMPAQPSENDRLNAAGFRQQAKTAANQRNGRRCLQLLARANRLDPAGRGRLAMLRARCEMLSGQCTRGRRRYGKVLKRTGYSPAQRHALEAAAVKRYCAGR